MTESAVKSKYSDAGVDAQLEERSMATVKSWARDTFGFAKGARVCLDLGYYANVIDIGGGIGIAISTDGVGTKILIAQMVGRLSTIGIDCVAMNVNDVLCVGARPISMVDYIATQSISPEFLAEIGAGLREGARQAGISIPGGEIAQVGEMLHGVEGSNAFDIVGAAIGVVPVDRINHGQDVKAGDVVIGLPSSGIHSNGMTLARRALLKEGGLTLDRRIDALGRTLGEELLEPTRIYVREVMAVLEAGVAVKSLAHITSDGFMNLTRAAAPVGFVLDNLPEPHAIFRLIQEKGGVSTAEMHTVYNMGIGFCVVVAPNDADRTMAILKEEGGRPTIVGKATDDPEKKVLIPGRGLIGRDGEFEEEGERTE